MQIQVLASLLLAAGAVAAPVEIRCPDENAASSLVSKISQIAPTSSSCAGSSECRTAAQAGPLFQEAFNTYGITTKGAQAAVLALSAFESVDFKYSHNVSPGRPGQGTSNMQMYSFNLKYAQSITALKDKLAALGGDLSNASDQTMNDVLALVRADNYNFGSGSWFLKTQCSPTIMSGLDSVTTEAYSSFLSECVGTSLTSDRQAYWTRAQAAFGLSG